MKGRLMQTQKERIAIIRRDLGTPDLTVREIAKHLYNFYRYERAIRQLKSGSRDLVKYAAKLNEDTEVFQFRSNMEKL